MTMKTLNDDALDALLSAPDEALTNGDRDADAFTAAVMHRVQAEAAARMLEAPEALARLQRETASLCRAAVWRRRGMALGSAVAAGAWFAFGGASLPVPPHTVAALLAAAAVSAWALAAPAGAEPG
jgi:hypothetical protein